MVYKETDPFNNAERYDVLINKEDAQELSVAEGEGIVLHNGYGVFQGRAKFVDIAKGNIEVHFPEGNCLLPKGRYEQFSKIPDYNIAITVEKQTAIQRKRCELFRKED